MRRPILLGSVIAALLGASLVAGCGYHGQGRAAPDTVQGSVPTQSTTTTPAAGNAAAGKSVFTSSGCGSCHTFGPAGSSGTVGPNLDNLAANAQKANQGSLEEYTRTSIVSPSSYVVPGFPNGVMPSTYGSQLSDTQLADLIAFLTQKS